MKKLVLKIDIPDDAAKRKAMKTVAAFPGIDSISADMKERKLTIIGTADPTKVVSRLRKYWTTELVIVGPAKEPEKKEDPKKDDAKPAAAAAAAAAGEAKKEGGGGDQEKKPAEEAKKEGGGGEVKKETEAATKPNAEALGAAGVGGEKKEEEKKVDPVLEMVRAYRAYNPHMTKYYYAQSMEENPNACVIC